jgi:hypothetical protein
MNAKTPRRQESFGRVGELARRRVHEVGEFAYPTTLACSSASWRLGVRILGSVK